MTKVGSEYVIAHALIKSMKDGNDSIPLSDVQDFGWEVQKRCNAEGVDALIIRSECDEAIALFPRYFRRVSLNGVSYVQAACSMCDLNKRFFGYLPLEVLVVLNGTPLPDS